MPLRIAQKTLQRLEWTEVVARLRDACRTPQARARLGAARDEADARDADEREAGATDAEAAATRLLEGDLARVRERQRETSEARGLLDGGEEPPFGGVGDLEPAFRRAAKGGLLAGVQLLEVASSLAAIHAIRGYLVARAERAPGLAASADVLSDRRALQRAIEASLDASGEVRDDASPELRAARQEAHRLSGDLQRRLARSLRDPDVAGALSDDYYTVRNDRYVLPVRADMRGKVPGIVHDASASGTTVFVEPQALVDLNNRLKQAELAAEREARRVIQALGGRVAGEIDGIRSDLEMLAALDLAFARARLSVEMDAVEPRIERDGIFDLPQLRHPLLDPADAVPNDLRLGETCHVMVISGPNGGGKTVAMKSVALAALFARAGLHVPASPGARVALVDGVLADIGDDQDIRQSLSTFSAHMANVAEIVRNASAHHLVVLDELGVGTDPSEGAALAQAVLERLADAGARVIATTHYNLLKEMAAVDPRFGNASFEFDPRTLAPTFRLRLGVPGSSSAASVASRMGMPSSVLDRADALMEREDRQLDRLLEELANERAAIDREQREAERLRREGESVRDEYRAKLEQLQARRERLHREMRADLDRAFREAHEQVAAVIRDLQRGGGARDAARAREKLLSLETRTREAEAEAGLAPEPVPAPDAERAALDWRRVRPGDAVEVAGAGVGEVESLPDRRGRVKVRIGAARLVVPTERVFAAAGRTATARPRPRVRVDRATAAPEPVAHGLRAGGTVECDLRGQRVEAALEELSRVLDRAARDGEDCVRIVHGIGTGALRRAVRECLEVSPYVESLRAGEEGEGGDGVTFAALRA